MAHVIKWQPQSRSAAFQECLKPAITGFQPLMRPLLSSHLPKGALSQARTRLRGCRHRATLGTAGVHDALNCSPPKKRGNGGAPAPRQRAALLPTRETAGTPLRSSSRSSFPVCQPSPVHLLILVLPRTSSPTPALPRVFFSHRPHTHVRSLIPTYSFTHLRFLWHPTSFRTALLNDAWQLLPP